MLSAAACSTRLAIFFCIASSVCLLLVLFTFSESFSKVPLDIAHKAQEHWKGDSSSSPQPQGGAGSNEPATSPPSTSFANKIYNCEDPYRRPGYLHIDPETYKKTSWIPYTDDFLEAGTPDYAGYPVDQGSDIYFNVTDVEEEFADLTSTPQQWMHAAITEDHRRRKALTTKVEKDNQSVNDFVGMKDEGDIGWLWGRRVLLLGDSVDRYMIQFFCEEFGRQMKQPMQHTTATCHVPTLNFTLIHWHYAGSYPYRPEWWWMDDMKEIAFEDRWDNLWAPTIDEHVRGPNGRPDLVLWQNGLWDQRALWESGEAHYLEDEPLGTRERQLVWQEVRFLGARLKKFVERIHEEFGADVPAMFRAITVHRESSAQDANIYELDRLARAVAEHAGHETFEWGRIITAFSMLYKDQTHTGKGPGSWLWSNMILEYVARSAAKGDEKRSPYFDSWGACHSQLKGWGGR